MKAAMALGATLLVMACAVFLLWWSRHPVSRHTRTRVELSSTGSANKEYADQPSLQLGETRQQVEEQIGKTASGKAAPSQFGVVSGQIVGHDDRPIVGARVEMHCSISGDAGFHGPVREVAWASSDQLGMFRISGVAAGIAKIRASCPGYRESTSKRLMVLPGALLSDVKLVLRRGGRVIGYVDPLIGEVADRQISLIDVGDRIRAIDVRTDTAGHFTIEDLVPQNYVIELRPAEYGSATLDRRPGVRQYVLVEDGEDTWVVFGHSKRRILIRGQVMAHNAPVVGVIVTALAAGSEDLGEECKTGIDGAFDFCVSGPGDYWFCVRTGRGSCVWLQDTVRDKEEVAIVLEVPSGSVSGQVVNAQGQPLGDIPLTVTCSICAHNNYYRDCYRRTYTDVDGRFSVGLLAPNAYTLRAPDGFQGDSGVSRVEYGRIVLSGLWIESAERLVTPQDIQVILKDAGRLSGIVMDAQGNPVANACIALLDQQGQSLTGDKWETQTNAKGRFGITCVAPGVYTVRARARQGEVTSEACRVDVGRTAHVKIAFQ